MISLDEAKLINCENCKLADGKCILGDNRDLCFPLLVKGLYNGGFADKHLEYIKDICMYRDNNKNNPLDKSAIQSLNSILKANENHDRYNNHAVFLLATKVSKEISR